jgi:hypothetical protein
VTLYEYIYIYIYIWRQVSSCVSYFCLSVYLSVCQSVSISVYLSLCLSVCLSVYLSIYLSIYLWLYSPYGPWPLFQSLNLHTVGRTTWTSDQLVAKQLRTHGKTHIQKKRTQTSKPPVGFEPTIPVFSGRRRFMPQTARPLWSAYKLFIASNYRAIMND